MEAKTQETPLMRQYHRAKAECPPGTLLLFRIGDFYEFFEEDAREAAALLALPLTRRAGAAMCGVPYHAAERYIAALLRAGRQVAICDQVETAGNARGIIHREVTAILKPENK